MGSGNFDVKAYTIQAKEAKASKNSGFTAATMCDEFNPAKVQMRFSKRGPFNEFRDVITVLIGLDVTGSMDIIPKSLLAGRLGSLMEDLKETFKRPNENLQISFAGIGDAKSDEAPLQVTHFESDNRFAQQLQKIWLEGHGGANGAESYNLLWWYAANRTHLNYVTHDKRKGILITIGDDNVHPDLTANEIQMWLDPKYDGGSISNQVLLNAAQQQYNVYHIIITDGQSYEYDNLKRAKKTEDQKRDEAKQWSDLLGPKNVIHAKSEGVADAIATIIKRHRPDEKVNMANLPVSEWEKKNKEQLTDEQWKEVLSYTLCPLTRQFMTNPVDWNGGKRAYEKQAVENYVLQHQRDPITQKKVTLPELMLKLNLNIAQLCSNYKPFFDALPESRRERLIQLTLPPQMQAEDKKTISSGILPSESGARIDSLTPTKLEVGGEVKPARTPESGVDKIGKGIFNLSVSPNASSASAVLSKDDDNIPHLFQCPISRDVMKNPVMAEDGISYERSEIEKWFEKHNTSPVKNIVIGKILISNTSLKSEIDQWRQNQASKPVVANAASSSELRP